MPTKQQCLHSLNQTKFWDKGFGVFEAQCQACSWVSSLLKTSEVTFKRAQITLGRLLLPGQCKDVISADCFQSRTSSVESHPEQYRADKGSERCTLGRQIGGLSIGATCSPVPPDLWGEESAAHVAAWQCFTAAPHSAWRSDAINRVQC